MSSGRQNEAASLALDRAEFGFGENETPVIKFGANLDIDTGTLPEDVWRQGGTYVFPTAARVHAVISTSTADTSAGTGMRTVHIYGLDANFVEQDEEVILAGVTPVNTLLSYLRVFRMVGITAGTGGTNAGAVTATAATDATVSAVIAIGIGQTQLALYTVPAGKRFLMEFFSASIIRDAGGAAAAQATVVLQTRDASLAAPCWNQKYETNLQITGSGNVAAGFPSVRYVFPAKTDIKATVTTVTDSNTGIEVLFAGFLRAA